ncbi:hypothetical protein [Kitasatospora sp. NPDC004272]
MRVVKPSSAGTPAGRAALRTGVAVAYVAVAGAADLLLSALLARLLAGPEGGLPLLLLAAFFVPIGALIVFATDHVVSWLLARTGK